MSATSCARSARTRASRWLLLGAFVSASPNCIAPPSYTKASGAEILPKKELARYAVIPRPRTITPREGQFTWAADTRIVSATPDAKARGVADYLAHLVATPTGFQPAVEETASNSVSTVELRLDASRRDDEGYHLSVTPARVQITARTARGLFYGVQTLRQLLPVAIDSQKLVTNTAWQIPAVEIDDAPRFAYRGMHLDVARHFFPPDFIKRYIDFIARFRMNTFHWHLTDDQGFRIEIKQYPKLSEIAAYRKQTLVGGPEQTAQSFDGTPHGGFYTQDQIREIVKYAEERFVTIVPEIEMPGHVSALLAAYPEFACTPGPFEVATRWGVFEDVLCPKDETFTFLQNVLSEVIELFPGPYLHIGGDEAPRTRWMQSELVRELKAREGLKTDGEVQAYFIRRVNEFVVSKGKRVIGWDEILEGGLPSNALVMSWRGFFGGMEAARQGHQAIMSPASHCYFDQYQVRGDGEPIAIGGYIPLEKVYGFDPVVDGITVDQARMIIGAQGNVWTEYMKTPDQVEYMIFPRMLALSEVVWSPKEVREYESFLARLSPNLDRLERMGVRVARHAAQ